MKTLEIAQAAASLAEYAGESDPEPIIVTDRTRPVAALVPLHDVDLETAALSVNPQFLALIERSRARQEAEGSISSDEMRRRLGLESRRSG